LESQDLSNLSRTVEIEHMNDNLNGVPALLFQVPKLYTRRAAHRQMRKAPQRILGTIRMNRRK